MTVDKSDELKIQNLKKNYEDKLARENIEATLLAREKTQAMKRAQDEDSLKDIMKAAMTKHEGHEMAWWDKLDLEANRAIHSEQNAYNDWRSAMMSLLSMFTTLVNAMSNSFEQKTGPLSMKAKRWIRENAVDPIKHRIIDLAWGDQSHDVPALLHNVTLSDDDKLTIGDVRRADNGDIVLARGVDGKVTDDFNMPYKTLVTLWLNTHGYQLAEPDLGPDNVNRNADVYVDAAGARLTKATFEGLKNDNEHGLTAFMQRQSGVEFRPDPSSPTASPAV